jgi:HB1/ASXL restriction endonuclease-like protein with HTH domain
MKKDQVVVGNAYTAKVSGGLASVRITGEKWNGDKHAGWAGVNTQTNRPVRIKSAQRLRALAKPVAAEPKKDKVPANVGAVKAGKTAKGAKPKLAKAPKPDRPLSGLDAAAKVLKDSGKPMRVGELLEAILKKGLWNSKGKTPEATLYAAIIREIFNKGVDSRFKKTGKGLFAAA